MANALTDQRKLQLFDWLRHHEAEILEHRPPHANLADSAAAALGFPVSAGNITGALRVVEIHYRARPAADGLTFAEQTRLDAIEGRLGDLERLVAQLSGPRAPTDLAQPTNGSRQVDLALKD